MTLRSSASAGSVSATGRGPEAESAYAWWRLAVSLLLSTIGGVGMWSVVVTLPTVQAEFGVARSAASLPYTFTMIGFGFGGMLLGRLSDRRGIVAPLGLGTLAMGSGFMLAYGATTLSQFTLLQGLLIGVGSSVTFAPLLADVSHWFTRRRGVAVAVVASGNYLAGAIWPPVVQHFVASEGWRATYLGIGLFCLATMLPLALCLRRRAPIHGFAAVDGPSNGRGLQSLGLSPAALQSLLVVAGLSCCVAMSMPQVHLVAYCGDLGYGAARGAEMLSLMLTCGVISRLSFGWVSDHIGGLRTLLLGSGLQAFALLLFLPFDSLISLYVIAALFGLFQGGIVPSYAIIIREFFPAAQAASRLSMVITATIFGMALGGWMSGAVFDLTGSYQAAFVNGILWNALNLAIAAGLLWRVRRGLAVVSAAT